MQRYIEFRLDMEPPTKTAQMKGACVMAGLVHHYIKTPIRRIMATIMTMLLPHKPNAPLVGPIALTLELTWPWRKTEPKWKIRQHTWWPKDTKPDADNVGKLLIDCMTKAGFWADDSQIADLRIVKRWGENVGIVVMAREMIEKRTK